MARHPNRIRQKLQAGGTPMGVNVQTSSPDIVEMVALAGYDHVMIDWEHGSFGAETVLHMIRAAEACGVTPIVRVPDHGEAHIKRVLDMGAKGIVAPHVSTAAQAREIVAAATYFDGGNAGARGSCPSVRAAGHLSADWERFSRDANDDRIVAISIESMEGVENFAGIARVPGIDAIFMGTFDLAHSMGLFGRSSHPDVVAAVERVTAIAREAGIPVHATLVADTADALTEEMERWKRAGARIFNVISDRRLISLGLAGRLDQAREAMAAG